MTGSEKEMIPPLLEEMTQAKDQILESENYFLKMETNSV
jgi:hypothetical protein